MGLEVNIYKNRNKEHYLKEFSGSRANAVSSYFDNLFGNKVYLDDIEFDRSLIEDLVKRCEDIISYYENDNSWQEKAHKIIPICKDAEMCMYNEYYIESVNESLEFFKYLLETASDKDIFVFEMLY